MEVKDAQNPRFFSLRIHVLILLASTVVTLFLLLYFPLRIILLNSFLDLENREFNRDLQRVFNEIEDTEEVLAAFALDYAFWDDTYNFMETRDPDYIASTYVSSSYIENRLNLLLIVAPSGEILYGEAFDLETETPIPIPNPLATLTPDSPLLQIADQEAAIVGVMTISGTPTFIAVFPILTTLGEGPARGSLIMGRFINDTEIARLAGTTELPLTSMPVDAPEIREIYADLLDSDDGSLIRPLDRQTIAGYVLISDVEDTPALILQMHMPRDIYAQGLAAFTYLSISIFIAVLAVGVAVQVLLDRVVLARLTQLGARVGVIGELGARGDFSKRVSVGGRDELALLGGHINAMLDNLEHYQRALLLQKQRFEDMVAVARATVERPALESTLQNALEVARQLTRAERGSLFLLNEVGAVTYSILARRNVTPAEQKEVVGQVMSAGLAGWVVQHRQPVLLPDTAQDERWLTLPNEPYVARSALAVPILSGVRKVGILTLTHPLVNHFNQDDLQLMQGAADQMALAIRNAQIYDDQRRLAERQTTLYEVLNTVSTHLDPESVLIVAAQTVAERTGWPLLAIFLYDERTGTLINRAAVGDVFSSANSIAISEGIVGRAYRERRTQYVANVNDDPDYVIIQPATICELAVPLRRGEELLGVFNIEHDHEMAFRADDIVLAESLADAIVLAITNAQLFQAVAGERKRLEALIATSQDGIIFINLNLRVMVINAAAITMLVLPGTPEQWVNRSIHEFLGELRRHAPSAARRLLYEIRRIQKGDEVAAEGEETVEQCSLHWINLPVIQSESSLGRLIVLHDMTEERLLERMRDDLTHMMVHDLRNPLTGIYSSLKLLLSKGGAALSSDHRKMLEIADNNAQRMLHLVNAILDISRLQNGQMPLEYTGITLAVLVADVVRLQQPMADQNKIQIEVELMPDLPQVWGDARLIERVFQNLIGNAIKFTPEGGSIRITAYHIPEQPAKLYISIGDTGPGIAPEIREHLFEKFTTGKQQGRGTGLGLAFCKMALVAHGENIWVDSTGKRGTTFVLTLPVQKG
ncbi:MAG: GAF domain-containing protein [Anaerolineae bacterium]|nr:GAF domain-containing protein [Anaerolineae bacterium]